MVTLGRVLNVSINLDFTVNMVDIFLSIICPVARQAVGKRDQGAERQVTMGRISWIRGHEGIN